MTDGKQTAAEAFGAFSQKLQRFIASGASQPAARTAPRSPQEQLNDALSEQKKAVITRYKGFLTPDAATAKDQTELLAAYQLFKAVLEANATHATEATRLDSIPLQSPLTKLDRYTIGGDFIYLQCWLYYEKAVTDYIPQLIADSTEVWRLQFVPARHQRITYSDKEKLDTIKACYYPGH